jgi:hypothetical protein
VRGCGELAVVLRWGCFFSELRVITLKREKYSKSKNYYYQILNLHPLKAPAEEADHFFLSTLLYTDEPTQKTAPPPVTASSKPMAI